ncbi:MAG: YigZ family protein [Clostridiales bacterium]|nr:YigZ family protein [Clostridiales bacterium]
MSLNITLSKTGDSKIEVKKSVFIGRSFHITSPEDAAQHLASERKKYPDARHLCYAWVLGGDNARQKTSDDGEPQGTAGQPLLELLTSNGFTDTLVCVTRYFGGTLLGTGGLRRAYSDSGRQALISGEPVTLIPALRWHESCSYPFFETLSRKASSSGWTVENIEYGQDVTCDITVPEERESEFVRFCLDASGGTVAPEDPEKILMKGEKISIS